VEVRDLENKEGNVVSWMKNMANPLNDLKDRLSGEEKQREDTRTATDKFGFVCYELQETIWDSAIVLFIRTGGKLRFGDRITVIVALLINHVLQLCFIVVVAATMLDDDFAPNRIEQMLTYRLLTGQARSHVDDAREATQTQLICDRESWSWRTEQYHSLTEYLGETREDLPVGSLQSFWYSLTQWVVPGYFLSIAAITLWSLMIIREFRCASTAAEAVVSLSPPDSDHPDLADHGGSFQLRSITRTQKVLFIILVTIPRYLVLFGLAITGTEFLAKTWDIKEIILNAVGLAFILDIDELVYTALLPVQLQELIRRMDPVPIGRRKEVGGISIRYFSRLIMFVPISCS
jgi:hypothetical protein